MYSYKKASVIGATIFILIIGLFFLYSKSNTFEFIKTTASDVIDVIGPNHPQKLAVPPVSQKGIYISAWTLTNTKKVKDLIQLIKDTELNTVVVDVKDASGMFSYNVDIPLAEKIGANNKIKTKNIDSLITQLHNDNIYVIGRVQVFQDPVLAEGRPDIAIKDSSNKNLWKDAHGLAWLDPSSKIAWQYAVDIAKDMATHGFDEVNYDYVRFPTDGQLEKLSFPFWNADKPKYELIGNFFAYLNQELKNISIAKSADVFGLTSWRAMDFKFDLNIGQRLIDTLPYFDYVSPMVYPSHYPSGFNGIKTPAAKPYEIVYGSLSAAQSLVATTSYKAVLRPWLQDFTLGSVEYDKNKVREQIKAASDVGIQNWLLWNSSNRYTQDALLPK